MVRKIVWLLFPRATCNYLALEIMNISPRARTAFIEYLLRQKTLWLNYAKKEGIEIDENNPEDVLWYQILGSVVTGISWDKPKKIQDEIYRCPRRYLNELRQTFEIVLMIHASILPLITSVSVMEMAINASNDTHVPPEVTAEQNKLNDILHILKTAKYSDDILNAFI